MKVTIVYESMFGNTHDLAQAIGDGLREAQPDADIQCVPVGEASAEVSSADLLVVGGPTHIRGMTTGLSRKKGISGEEKAEAKGKPAHERAGCRGARFAGMVRRPPNDRRWQEGRRLRHPPRLTDGWWCRPWDRPPTSQARLRAHQQSRGVRRGRRIWATSRRRD
jgi:hypothetical protein